MGMLIKPVVKTGLIYFLMLAFGGVHIGLVAPVKLAKQLFDFEGVGCVIYKRSKSKKSELIKAT